MCYFVAGKLIQNFAKLKREVSREFDVISKHRNVFLSTETKKLSSFVINYHPSAIKLSISASGQRQSGSESIET